MKTTTHLVVSDGTSGTSASTEVDAAVVPERRKRLRSFS